jgi:hypothetical protein
MTEFDWEARLRTTTRVSTLHRLTFTAAFLAVGCAASGQDVPWPTNGWAVATPQAQGLREAPFTDLASAIESGVYGHIDRMVVVRNGYLVVSERYDNDYRTISRGFEGALGCGEGTCRDDSQLHEFNYYHPDWHPYYQGRDVHSLQSVTKSVSSALIGVAIGRGEIAGTEAPLLSFFDDYDLTGVDPRLRQATLDDLLTHRSGIEWHENDRPLDETNTTMQLEHSEDWIQFTLDQPSDAAPGEKWVYNSGGSHLMSGIIRKATGRYIDEYAEEHLFGPLGIDDYHWKKTPRGFPDTEGGLYLQAEQLAKIGYLYLQGGVWDGERVLPEGWAENSTARHVDGVNAAGWGYGYQWWRLDTDGHDVWAGLGFGGQFLVVIPEYELIGVVNSWNLFGASQSSILGAFIQALLASASR